MMYSLVLGDNNKCTLMHDFWIFVRTNLATLGALGAALSGRLTPEACQAPPTLVISKVEK